MAHIGSPALISFYSVCFVSFYFFLFFKKFFVDSTTCWGIEVSLSMLKIKQWSCTLVSKWSFERLVALALFCNYCNWFDSVWEKFELHLTSTCLSKILAAEYLRETNISVIIIIIINGYLFFRCLKKVFEEEKNENKKENSRGLTTS